MTAIRSVHTAEGKFVQIANAAMQDHRLSFTARGILAYVLSLPPDHYLTSEWLESQATESRRVMRAALRELETCGYYRKTKKSGGRGAWVWEHVMSDAPITDEGDEGIGEDEFSQVVSSDHHRSDVDRSDVNRSDKELNTETSQHEDQKMVQGRASRRAHASGERATRTVGQVVREIREAVALVQGQQQADELYDDDALGLYYTYVKGRARDVTAYMSKILGDVDHVDALLSNSTPVCVACVQYESNCHCPAAA